MNYIVIPSLEHMALAKIAITLWGWDNAEDFIPKNRNRSLREKRSELKPRCEMKAKAVKEKSYGLQLPAKLKEKVLSFILPVGFQISSWIDFHMFENEIVDELPVTFFWTPMGTIDKKRTAEVMMKEGNLSIDERFNLACIYCLEEEIHNLWKTKLEKKYYCIPQGSVSRLVSFWYENLSKEATKTCFISYASAFSLSAEIGNETATRYFLQKLDSESKSDNVMKTARHIASIVTNHRHTDMFCNEHISGIFLFLLSVMDVEQQTDIFTSHIYEVLKCLLIWPWNVSFLEMVNVMWKFLSFVDYSKLLLEISRSREYKHNLYKLLALVWHHSPQTYKESFINSPAFEPLILNLCSFKKYDKNLRLILKDVSISAKKNLIFSKKIQNILETLVYLNRFNTIELLIQECISSREELLELKDHFKCLPRSNHPSELRRKKKIRELFFQFVQKYDLGFNKRKHTEENIGSSKIICSEPIQE